jgi:hypothetical protein
MDLLEEIKKRVESCDKNKIITDLGYNSKKKGMKKLNALLCVDSLENWLKEIDYDFLHTSRTFLIKLCTLVDIDEKICKSEIENIQNKLLVLNNKPRPYIIVNTDLKRNNESLLTLLLYFENYRRIYPSEINVFESSDNGLSEAKKLVKNHYIKNEGNLRFWGKIINYIYYINDSKYILSKDGEVLPDNDDIKEPDLGLFYGSRDISKFFDLGIY